MNNFHLYALGMYLTGFEVAHKFVKGAPSGYFQNDINKGFGGTYTYLKPQWSNDRSKAVSSFKLMVTDRKTNDVCIKGVRNKGVALHCARGKHMYLVPIYDDNALKITCIRISNSRLQNMDDSINMNEKRQGADLYLSWNRRGILLDNIKMFLTYKISVNK